MAGYLDARPHSAGSNAVTADVRLSQDPDAFLEQLSKTIISCNIDTVIPLNDAAIRLLLIHYEYLQQKVAVGIPPPAVANSVLDKEETITAAARCGIRVPRSVASASEAAELKFPIIAKPSQAGLPKPFKIKYLHMRADLTSIVENNPTFDVGMIFQEFIPGEGVGLSTISLRGKPLQWFQHRRIHEWPVNGGVGVLVESEAVDPALARSAGQLLEALNWVGPAMVEFRREKPSGEYAFMEINGRFVGSLPLAIKCGFDLPYYDWQALHGIEPVVPRGYPVGTQLRWTSGEIFRLQELWGDPEARRRAGLTRVKAVGEFLSSFKPKVHSALFSLTDLKPGVQEVAHTIRPLALRPFSKLLPRSLRSRIRQYRQLDAKSRRVYRQLWWQRSLGMRKPARLRRGETISSVLFVCRGNRIRSPFAAALLTSIQAADGSTLRVESAGTHASPESLTDTRVAAAAEHLKIAIANRPQLLTSELVDKSDLIVTMDYQLEADIISRFPDRARQVFLLRELTLKPAHDLEILDPDKEPEPRFSQTLSTLQKSVSDLSSFLTRRDPQR